MNSELTSQENVARVPIDRRSFLMCALASGAALGAGELAAPATAAPRATAAAMQSDIQFTFEAKFYEKLPGRKIKCKLCPRLSALSATKSGATAGCAKIAAASTTRWFTRASAPRTSTPSKRSRSSITCPERRRFPLPPPAATSTASSVRTGTSRSRGPRRSGRVHSASPGGRRSPPIQLPHHCLHLQRARRLCGIPDGHR